MTLSHFVILSLMLCAIGVYGVLTRRNLIGILLSVEVILNGRQSQFCRVCPFQGI